MNKNPSPILRHCIFFLSFLCSACFLFGDPVLSIENTMHSFPSVEPGTYVSGNYQLENTGTDPLIISVQPSCPCLDVAPGEITIASQESLQLSFTLDTTEYSGLVDFAILLYSNDPQQPQTWLSIEGRIESGLPQKKAAAVQGMEKGFGFCIRDADRTDRISFISYSNCSDCLNTMDLLQKWAFDRGMTPVFYPLENEENKKSLFVYCTETGTYPELPLVMASGNVYAGKAAIEAFLQGDEKERVEHNTVLNVIAIFSAGLLDGINPCAFTLIILLISYLSLQLQNKKTILLTGLVYIAVVYVTYMLVGAGLFEFVRILDGFSAVRVALKYVTTAVLIILAILSFYDFFKSRKNKNKEMVLKLPRFLDTLVRKTIRNQMKNYKIIIGAVILGFTVSLIELACTGQVYFPVIGYIVRSAPMKGIFFLLIYNTGFIIPLLCVFLLVYSGISSKRIGGFFGKHVSKVKIAFALLFVSLAGVNLFF